MKILIFFLIGFIFGYIACDLLNSEIVYNYIIKHFKIRGKKSTIDTFFDIKTENKKVQKESIFKRIFRKNKTQI